MLASKSWWASGKVWSFALAGKQWSCGSIYKSIAFVYKDVSIHRKVVSSVADKHPILGRQASIRRQEGKEGSRQEGRQELKCSWHLGGCQPEYQPAALTISQTKIIRCFKQKCKFSQNLQTQKPSHWLQHICLQTCQIWDYYLAFCSQVPPQKSAFCVRRSRHQNWSMRWTFKSKQRKATGVSGFYLFCQYAVLQYEFEKKGC